MPDDGSPRFGPGRQRLARVVVPARVAVHRARAKSTSGTGDTGHTDATREHVDA